MTISIVHDNESVIDRIGPVAVAELKSEKMFNEHGPESVSDKECFVLWRDNRDPQLLVLSMVKKIPEGDVNNRCYRFEVRVQTDMGCKEHYPVVAYYDSSTLQPSIETRFAMASKTPKEASEKIKRVAAAAAAATTTDEPGVHKRVRSTRGRRQIGQNTKKWQHAATDDVHSLALRQQNSLVSPATDVAAKLVKLMTGKTSPAVADGTISAADMSTPCTPSPMLETWPVAAASVKQEQSAAQYMPFETQQQEQEQATGGTLTRRQVPENLCQIASASPSAHSHNGSSALSTARPTSALGCEATTIQIKTDPAGRMTLGL